MRRRRRRAVSRKRFRNLELRPGSPPPPAGDAPPSGPRRALGREGGLELDTSGIVRTDFCRRCYAENPEGVGECQACGAKLGGPGQEAFDAEMRAERARVREDHARAQGEQALPEALRTPPPLPELTRGSRSLLEPPPGVPDVAPPDAGAHEPGFGAVVATGALLAASFALVSLPVRLVVAGWAGQPVPSRAFGEILLCASVTLGLWWRFRRVLERL